MSEAPAQPQEAQMQAQAHEKSEAKVVEQMQRIAGMIGDRALALDAGRTDTRDNELSTKMVEASGVMVPLVSHERGQSRGDTTVNTRTIAHPTGVGIRKEIGNKHVIDIAANNKDGIIHAGVGSIDSVPSKLPQLSLEETKEAAAKIFSQTRGEIARREIESKKSKERKLTEKILAA